MRDYNLSQIISNNRHVGLKIRFSKKISPLIKVTNESLTHDDTSDDDVIVNNT